MMEGWFPLGLSPIFARHAWRLLNKADLKLQIFWLRRMQKSILILWTVGNDKWFWCIFPSKLFLWIDLTRVVCMGLNRLCNIKYLDLDARSTSNTQCEYCINIARLLDFQTRRASKKYIRRGFFFDNLLENVCEKIPFYYSSRWWSID